MKFGPVVPAQATEGLARRLADEPGVDVLQHGYAHVNHAGAGEKKTELGLHRPAMIVLGDLGTGWMALERLFGPRALNVLNKDNLAGDGPWTAPMTW